MPNYLDKSQNAYLPPWHPWNPGYAIPEYMYDTPISEGPSIDVGLPRNYVSGPGNSQRDIFAKIGRRQGVGAAMIAKGVHPLIAAAAQRKQVHAQARTNRIAVTKGINQIAGQMQTLAASLAKIPVAQRPNVVAAIAKLGAQHNQLGKQAVKAAQIETIHKVLAAHAQAKADVLALRLPAFAEAVLQKLIDQKTAEFTSGASQLVGSSSSLGDNEETHFGVARRGELQGLGHWWDDAAKAVGNAASTAYNKTIGAAAHDVKKVAEDIGHDIKTAAKAVGNAMKTAAKDLLNLAKKGLCLLGSNPGALKLAMAAGATAAGAPPSLTMGQLMPSGSSGLDMSQVAKFLPPGTNIPAVDPTNQRAGAAPAGVPTSAVLDKAGNLAAGLMKKACPGDPDPGMGPDTSGGGGGIAVLGALAAAALVL